MFVNFVKQIVEIDISPNAIIRITPTKQAIVEAALTIENARLNIINRHNIQIKNHATFHIVL